jgi:hypothetical protein
VLRLYIDEDAMSKALADGLRVRGVDVATVAGEGMRGHVDAAQLSYATAHGRAIFSFNVGDFMRIHSEWLTAGRSHRGIILVRQGRLGVGELIRRLLRIAMTLESDDMLDRIEFLNEWG